MHALQQKHVCLLDHHRKLVKCDESFEVLTAAKADFTLAVVPQTLNPNPDISGSGKVKVAIMVFKYQRAAISGDQESQFVEIYA